MTGNVVTTLLTGHKGLVGSALLRRLRGNNIHAVSSAEVDLRDRGAVWALFDRIRPAHVYHAATSSGGILANTTRPAEFLSDNLRMQTNLLDAAHEFGIERFLYLGTSRMYPVNATQPVKEECLLTGSLQPGLEPYAAGKIAGAMHVLALRRQFGHRFLTVIPCNLYGADDHFDSPGGHVVPMLIRRLHDAKIAGDNTFTIYGSGNPRREFLHADDLAAACVHLMAVYDDDLPVNVGSGTEITITALATLVAETVGFGGRFAYDTSKPDGSAGQLLDSSRALVTGWAPMISLQDGIRATYEAFLRRRQG